MSLNRAEQLVLDYLRSHPDEERYWKMRVERELAAGGDAPRLERALWSYFEERSRHASPFRELAAAQGVSRTSFRNLAELMLRLARPVTRGPKLSEFF